MATAQAAKSRLSHSSPYAGTGLRRQQSSEGAWLDAALQRGQQIAELLSYFRTNEEGYASVEEALGIKPRQTRSYLKLWSLRAVLAVMWELTPAEQLPRGIDSAIAAAQTFLEQERG